MSRTTPRPDAPPLAVDEEGFLLRPEDWNPEVAARLAAQDGITLEDPHWELIRLFRDYYQECGMIPILRVMAKVITKRLGTEQANGRRLRRLFPPEPLRQIARVAGLPKPPSCL